MRDKLFIDTWGWIVMLNKREQLHQEINTLYKKARREGWIIYTSDYVLDETWTLLFRRLPSVVAIKAMSIIYVLNALLDKGLVKATRFKNSKNKLAYMYILTTEGMVTKLDLTQSFLLRKMQEYDALKQEIEEVKRNIDGFE